MEPDEIEALLRQTLDDRKLSRGEKRALGEVLDDAMLADREVAIVRSRAFHLARELLGTSRDREALEWLEGVVKLLAPRGESSSQGGTHVSFSPGDACLNALRGAIDRTSKTADLCVFTITDDRLAERILEAKKRGVTVRIITDDEKAGDEGSDIARLSDAGIEVRADDSTHHMHHKFALFDDRTLATGSYNWTRSAANYNQENLIVTDDVRLVRPFRDAFEDLWGGFAELYSVRR